MLNFLQRSSVWITDNKVFRIFLTIRADSDETRDSARLKSGLQLVHHLTNRNQSDQNSQQTGSPSGGGRAVMMTSLPASGYWSSDLIGPAVMYTSVNYSPAQITRHGLWLAPALWCNQLMSQPHLLFNRTTKPVGCLSFLLFTTRLHQRWCHGVSLCLITQSSLCLTLWKNNKNSTKVKKVKGDAKSSSIKPHQAAAQPGASWEIFVWHGQKSSRPKSQK